MKNLFKILLFLLIILAGFAGLGIYWTFYRSLPSYTGTSTVPELEQRVDVHWDNYGVPHIYAQNQHDLYFTTGYVHARDRLWQMTLSALAAEGRLAEHLGRELLPVDIQMRTIGFWEIAGRIENQMDDSLHTILERYAEGVNRYISRHRSELPPAFSLTGMEPVEWSVRHSIALSRLMAWELNIAWKNEVALAVLADRLNSRQLQELLPGTRATASGYQTPRVADTAFAAMQKAHMAYQQLTGSLGSAPGSNAWAVNSTKSATDYPLLAGDPHLGLSMPGKWYEIHMNHNGRNLSGVTIAGIPFVVIGQNDMLAWSLTNVMADDSDFFVEAVDPANQQRYILDTLAGDPITNPFEIQRELIRIKGATDTVITRRLTKHGPVISDIYGDSTLTGNRVITLRWTGHDISHESEALWQINWSRSFGEFRRAIPKFKVPAQNIVYADRDDNIARFTLGNIPNRSGNPVGFRRGWNPEDDWLGYIPFDQLPASINPKRGWVANANNDLTGPDGPYISIYWEPESRYQRIRQYLTTTEQLTVPNFQAMQIDPHSDYSRRMTGLVLPILRESNLDFETAISYLENWGFSYDLNETAASIMDVFLLRLSRNTFEDEMGKEIYQNYIRFSGLPTRTILRFMQQGSSFFDDVTTDTLESRSAIVERSMQESLQYLNKRFGREPFEWRWENLHTLTLAPPLFGEAASSNDAGAALKLIVNNIMKRGPYPAVGHAMSLNNGEYAWTDPYRMVLGASARRIVDLSNPGRSLTILPTGQSGHPLSDYYGDQTENWLNGQYKYMYQDSSLFEQSPYRTTTLLPGR